MFGKKIKQYKASLLPNGFTIAEDEDVIKELNWNDIYKVVAYKRDLLTTDRICLDLWTHEGEAIVVDEATVGFEAFRKEMERVLVGIDSQWWAKVVLPPFATNETVIFRTALADADGASR